MMSFRKPNFYQVMIFITWTIHFLAGNLLFIHYSLFIIHILFPGFKTKSFKFEMKKKCKILRELESASIKSAFYTHTTELQMSVLFEVIAGVYPTSLFLWPCSNFIYITSFSSWVVGVLNCRCEGCRF